LNLIATSRSLGHAWNRYLNLCWANDVGLVLNRLPISIKHCNTTFDFYEDFYPRIN
jgi:hypothetical protein